MLLGDDVPPAAPTDQSQAAWWNAWGQLKQIITQLDEAVASLQANESYAMSRPDLAADYRTKMADVESMRSKATWVRDQIKSAADYFGMQLSGLRSVRVPQQLGFLPLLVWPVVAIAVAWLGTKALDLWQFSQQVDEQRRLEEKGVAPSQAAAIVKGKKDAGASTDLMANVATVAKYAAWGVGLFIAWKIFESVRGKR